MPSLVMEIREQICHWELIKNQQFAKMEASTKAMLDALQEYNADPLQMAEKQQE